MMIADVTATGDDNVLTSKSSDIATARNSFQRLQEEVIELEDVRTGISITDSASMISDGFAELHQGQWRAG